MKQVKLDGFYSHKVYFDREKAFLIIVICHSMTYAVEKKYQVTLHNQEALWMLQPALIQKKCFVFAA